MATYANNRPSGGMTNPYPSDYTFSANLDVGGILDIGATDAVKLSSSSDNLLLTIADSKAFKIVNGTGNTVVTLGDITTGLGATFGGLWLGSAAPSTTNWAIRCDSAGNTMVNGSNTLTLRIANNTTKEVTLDNNGDLATDNALSVGTTLTMGSHVYIPQSSKLSLNGATNTATHYYDGTDMFFDVPSSKGFKLRINSAAALSIASTNIATFTDSVVLNTAKKLKLETGGATQLGDESGNLVLDVATGKALSLEINGTEYLNVSSTRLLFKTGYIQAQDASLFARATEYGHTYMAATSYGGSPAYTMRANPTDGAVNTAFKIGASQNGGTTALSTADIVQLYAGTDAATKKMWVHNSGRVSFESGDSTGTPGNATINLPAGRSAVAAAATAVTITNSLVSASSIVLVVVQSNDTTALLKNVVPGSGTFTVNLNAAATADTNIGWVVVN